MSEGAGPYQVMPEPRITKGDIALRAVEPNDIEAIRQWRNAQMHVLRQSAPITPEDQIRYFSTYVWPEKFKAEPAQILLAIEYSDELVGYGGLVHISWPNHRAEVSFLLAPELERDDNLRSMVFGKFLRLLQIFAFEKLGLHRLYTETFKHRGVHLSTLESVGFRLEGCMRAHELIDGLPTDSLLHGCLAKDWERME